MRLILILVLTTLFLFQNSTADAQRSVLKHYGIKASAVSSTHLVNRNSDGIISNYDPYRTYGFSVYRIFREDEAGSIQVELGYHATGAKEAFETARVIDFDNPANIPVFVEFEAQYEYITLPVMLRLQSYSKIFSTYFLGGVRVDYLVKKSFATNNPEYGDFFYGRFFEDTNDFSVGLAFGIGSDFPHIGKAIPNLEVMINYDLLNNVNFDEYSHNNLIFKLSAGVRF